MLGLSSVGGRSSAFLAHFVSRMDPWKVLISPTARVIRALCILSICRQPSVPTLEPFFCWRGKEWISQPFYILAGSEWRQMALEKSMAMIVASNCRKEKPAKLRHLKVWNILRQCVFDQGLRLDLLPVKAFHCFQGREQLLLESEISSEVIGIEPASW